MYDESACELSKKSGSIKHYNSYYSIDKILIDIDKGDDSDVQVLSFARGVIFELNEAGLANKNMQAYFSGSGFHITIPNSAFNFKPDPALPLIVKQSIANLLPTVDLSIYSRTGIYRVAHTLNQKTNLFKIPLTSEEIQTLEINDIHELARNQRMDYPYAELLGEGELEEYVVQKPSAVIKFNKVAEPTKVVPCVQSLLRAGAVKGQRHNVAMRIISHFKRNGIPSEYAKVALLHWNHQSMDEGELIEIVERCYNANYRYSCNDSVLVEHCQTRCVFFKNKDYTIDIKNAEDMQKELSERLTADFSGRTLNIARSLGLNDIDAEIYPGELVTIFGPTGSNKTTLAQNLALGVDFANDGIVKSWQIPTLFLSLELSAWYMHRRHLQIVSGLNKDSVNADYKNIFNQHEDLLSHLVVQTVAPTLDQIRNKIRDLQPALVIVDYIDLIETPMTVRGEYEKIKYVSHGLSNMAVNMDLIIIQISQVAREYSRNEVLDLYAGKGSGAIENASRKVIGLNGQADSTTKNLQVFKNTDGELFEQNLRWRPSFRMECTDAAVGVINA